MKKRGLAGAWAAALFLAVVVASVHAEDYDAWICRYDGDVKTGFSHVVRKETSETGERLIRTEVTRSFAYFKGQEISWQQFITILEAPSGEIRSFSVSSTTSQGRGIYEGKVEGGKAKIFQKAPDFDPKEFEIDWDAAALGPAAEERMKAEFAQKGGRPLSIRVFSLDYLKPIDFTLSHRGKRGAAGAEGLTEIKVETSAAPGAYYWEYRTANGAFSRTASSDGMAVEASSGREAAEARQKGVLAIYPVSACIPCPGTVVHPREARASVIRMTLGGQGDFSQIHFKWDGQRLSEGGGKSKSATVNVNLPALKAAAEYPETDAKFKPFLDPSYFLDFDQDGGAAEKKAREIAGQEKNSLKAAAKMSAWISSEFKKLPINCGFAAASGTLVRGEGDCSDLSVLLCSMARSIGIPAKIAGGFCLQGGYFVFHAWAEVWAGAWHQLDPTGPDGLSDAMRVKLGETDLMSSSPEYALLAAGSVANDLRFASVAYQIGSAVIEAAEEPPDQFHSISGDVYMNQLFGFGFTKPASWSVSTRLPGITGGLVAIFGRSQQERVLVRPHMAEYSLDYGSLLRKMEVNYNVGDLREVEVGGVKAVVVKTSMRGGGYSPLTCYVLNGGVMYAIESNDCSEDCGNAFEYMLRTMKFKKS